MKSSHFGERGEKAARYGVTMVAAGLLAFAGSQAVLRISPSPVEASPVEAITESVEAPPAGRPAGEGLAALHLFGEASVDAAPPPEPEGAEAPETPLKLTLRGVFADSDPMKAYAIISDEDGGDRSYGIGDALPGGVTLKEVLSDRVVLLRHGRFETLRMPRVRQLDGEEGMVAPQPPARPVPNPRMPSAQRQTPPPPRLTTDWKQMMRERLGR